MFSSKYITQKLRFFAQYGASASVFGAGVAATAYYYDEIMTHLAENEVKIFKNSLSPEQTKEMESSPEMNEKYMRMCEENIRKNFRYD